MRSILIWLCSAYSVLTIVGTTETEIKTIIHGIKSIRKCANQTSLDNGKQLHPLFFMPNKESADFIRRLSPEKAQKLSDHLAEALNAHCDQSYNCASNSCVTAYSNILLDIAELEIRAAFPPPAAEPGAGERPMGDDMVETYDLWLKDGPDKDKPVYEVLNEYLLCRPPAGGMYENQAMRNALCFISKQSDEIKNDAITEADGMNRKGCGQWQNCQGDGMITCDSGYTSILTMGHWTEPCK